MEVQYDCEVGYSTVPIDKVYKSNEDYNKEEQEAVILY